jgi:hypothetical protein
MTHKQMSKSRNRWRLQYLGNQTRQPLMARKLPELIALVSAPWGAAKVASLIGKHVSPGIKQMGCIVL